MPAQLDLIKPDAQEAIRDAIGEALGKAWREEGHQLDLSGNAVGDEVLVRIFFETNDQSTRYLQEIGLDAKTAKLPHGDALAIAVDVAGGLFVEFVEAGYHTTLPLEWGQLEVDGQNLRCRAELTRPKLDSLADQWLAGEGAIH